MKLIRNNLLFAILVSCTVAVKIPLFIARGRNVYTHLASFAVGIVLLDTKWILPVN